jgi:hypothetical protein
MADQSKPGQIVRVSIQNGRQSHLKHGHKKCPRDDHLKAGLSGFQMVTVVVNIQKWAISGFQQVNF